MSLFWRITLTCLGLWLLAMITFPFFQQGNLTGMRRATCMSNIKQLGLALYQYTQDSDSTLPLTVSTTGKDWRETIYPYVKSTAIYQCPDDRRSGSYSPTNLPKSYGVSTLGPGQKGTDRGAFAGPTEKPMTMSEFPSPSNTIAVTDMRGGSEAGWNMTSPAFLPATGRRLYAHFPSHWFYEHPGGTVNCLFMDDHVKALAPDATLTPTNLWTRDSKPFTGPDLKNAQAILARAAQE